MHSETKRASAGSLEAKRPVLFARLPLSTFGKLAVAALLGAAAASGVLAIDIGSPGNIALLIITASLLVCAGMAASGFRWMPVLIALVSGVFLYQISQQPFVTYHLTNPRTGGFLPFVLDVLITACMVVVFGASIGAGVENYRRTSRKAPAWLPAALTGVAGMVIGCIGYLAHPFDKKALWAVIASLFQSVRETQPPIEEGNRSVSPEKISE